MKYSAITLTALLMMSCSSSNDTPAPKNTAPAESKEVATAKSLCLEAIAKAEQATGELAVPATVTDAYKNITCNEVSDELRPLWQCMKDQIDAGKGFYGADTYCNEHFQD